MMLFFPRISILILCCFICSIFAKQKEGHVNDMWSVFPFRVDKRNDANKKIDDFFVDVHSYLDYCDYPLKINNNSDRRHSCNNLCELLQTESCPLQVGNISKGDHRIFYHWGWTPEAKNVEYDPHYDALKNLVIRSCERESRCVNSFFDSFNKIKQKRDKHLQDQYAVLIGKNKFDQLSNQEQKIGNAFIRIACTVHILGDYTTNQGNDKTQEFSSILEDLSSALIDLSSGNKASVNDFIYELKTAAYLDPDDSKKIGESALNYLSKNFSNFLYKAKYIDYKKMFKAQGYIMK